jgi:hypothetical protein
MELTTADKINGALMVFAEPKFYLQLAFVALVLFGISRAGRTARSIPTKTGRLGLVLHRASLLVAVILLAIAGVILAEAPKNKLDAGLLAVAAAIVWLVGKAARYILAGPSVAPPTTLPPMRPQASPRRSTSVPTAGIASPIRPWGPPRDT